MIIKQIPEDFIVEELINLNLSNGNYSIYKLTKKNWDTFKILETIARILNTKIKFIGYAGNKDKKAVTTQYISFYKIPKNRIDRIKINDVKLEFLGYSPDRINLGDLKGNKFIITARNLDKKSRLPSELQLENYFDDQRFGNKSNTHLVGKAIIKKDFKEACKLLNLEVKNNDYVGVLRTQHRRLLRFYISSYQSYIFNNQLSKIISDRKHFLVDYSLGKLNLSAEKIKNFNLPLISFDSKEDNILKEIIKKENISLNDFIIKQIPELITETQYREAFIEVKDIKSKFDEDELNKDKFKVIIEFTLPKGSYATLLIKKLESYLNQA